MSKQTTVLWGWRDTLPTPDPLMTRDRLAKLMRAWRRSRTQGRRNFSFAVKKREPNKRTYAVEAIGYDEGATVIVTNDNH